MSEIVLNAIFVGIGNIFNLAYKPILNKLPLNIVGLVDIDNEKLNKASLQLNIQKDRIFDNLNTALLKQNADLVIITAPTYLHYDLIKIALENKKDVIVEKPLANNLENLEKIIQLSEKYSNQRIFVGHTRRYDERYNSIKEQLSELGDILYLERKELGCLKYKKDYWFFDFKKSGNVILDVGIHSVDLVSWLIGKEIKKLEILAKSVSDEAKKHNYIDWAKFNIEFSDYQTAGVEVSWSHCINMRPFHSYLEIFTTNGKIFYEDKDANPLMMVNEKGITYPLYSPLTSSQLSSFYYELSDFINCIIDRDRKPGITLEEAYSITKLILSSKIKKLI